MDDPRAMFSLAGRVACVTGASSGLGRRAAIALAAAGAKVIGVARRPEPLAELREEAGCAVVQGDVADRDAFDDLRSNIAAPYGDPDILVHAAGVNYREPAEDISYDTWDKTLELNLGTPFFLSRTFVPAMKEKGWGRIIHFASLQTTRAFPSGIAYGASKAAIGQLTRAMAEAWSRFGITANAIGPGFFPTELTAPVFNDPERAARNAAQTCIGRNGRSEDLDGPLVFLASNASAYVTGQILMVDGGYTAK